MSAVETRNLKLETRRVRTCSHIKVNGLKCGSPALRHQTLCYFHFQWDRRERRRVRLGGPVGTNKNTGIEFPILEGPESIMLAIMEVQHALLDARIDRLTAHTLLYSLQLAMQLKIGSRTGLSATPDPVLACPELESELDLDRARGLRPSASVCSTCSNLDSCLNPKHCPQTAGAPFKPAVGLSGVVPDDTTIPNLPSSRPESAVADGAEGPAFSPATSTLNPTPTLNPCHPERRSPAATEAEGPSVSSPEASTRDITSNPVTAPSPAVETRNLKLETSLPSGETIAKINASRATARRQTIHRKLNPALKGGARIESSLRDESCCGWRMADCKRVVVETRNLKLETAPIL